MKARVSREPSDRRETRGGTRPPVVKVLHRAKGPAFPAGRMLVASPAEVEAIVRQVPSGRVLTLGTLRALLATKWRADYTCPLTTAIFVRVMAEAACHQHEETRAPYWRVVRDDGRLLDRLPGGAREQARHLRSEGLAVVDRRNNLFVESIDRCSWTAARLADSRD